MPIAWAIAALVASYLVQKRAADDAAERQRDAINAAGERDDELNRQTELKVKESLKRYETDNKTQDQATQAAGLSNSYMTPVTEAATASQTAGSTSGEVSNDYLASRAASTSQSMKEAHALAQTLGKINAASQIKTDDAIEQMKTGNEVGLVRNMQRGNKIVDELDINRAGQLDQNKMIVAGLLRAVGSAYLGGAAAGAAGGSTTAGATAGGTSSGIGGASYGTGVKTVNSVGARFP